MSDLLLYFIATLVAIIVIVPFLLGYVWLRTLPERRKEKAFALQAENRAKVTDLDFCIRSGLPVSALDSVATLRKSLGENLKIAPDFVYPEDEIESYGLYYDDDVSGFIFSCGLISKDPHWFPFEAGSSIRDIFTWVERINSEAKDGEAEEDV